jgi:hypothetical protein
MMVFDVALLSMVVWTGTAQVDVMIWEPGGEHPYKTEFELEYREAGQTPIRDSKGILVGHRVRLFPQRIALKVHHEVRGLLNCTGAGQEVVTDGPDAELVLPLPGKEVVDDIGFRVPPAGAYQLVLPRAIGAFACGNKRNAGDRWVIVGSGLYHPSGDIDAADAEPRVLLAGSTRMRGSYAFSDAARHQPVRHDYNVKWDLQRQVKP